MWRSAPIGEQGRIVHGPRVSCRLGTWDKEMHGVTPLAGGPGTAPARHKRWKEHDGTKLLIRMPRKICIVWIAVALSVALHRSEPSLYRSWLRSKSSYAYVRQWERDTYCIVCSDNTVLTTQVSGCDNTSERYSLYSVIICESPFLTSKVSFKEFGIEVGEPLVIQHPCNRLQKIFYQGFTYRNICNRVYWNHERSVNNGMWIHFHTTRCP